ncbi:ATP-binding protein [Saccharothrix sp. ST-888]|uniref:ATP-binding protein n=1 Tax=Saccharothrix sp. ST-888 TaxID=1427391 RepID=UPI000A46FE38|nr:tetratricopeptide repeat protein [Saccharothrix sp. ST-888]
MPGRFGEELRRYRLRAGLTQEELAERSGVSAHAISVLEAGRRSPRLSSVSRLAAGLGLEPVERGQLIAAVGGPDAPAAAAAGTGRPAERPDHRAAPCQLPYDTRLFTGRTRELEQLLRVAEGAPAGSNAGMVVVSAIDGMGGVGKSALAIRAAHRVRPRFPDGQLFVDLHGHTPGTAPLTAEDALGLLLRSLGVPPRQVPRDLGERAAFYRDRLAGTRTLVLLDNAASTAQVRPLLPGTPGCLVLITSRTHLAGLDDAHQLALDVLPGTEAVALLHEAAGPGRIPAGDPATAELVDLCARLPLAIRITGARLRHHRPLRVADLVEQLRDEHGRLGHLQDEDRSLTAVFDASYAALSDAEQRLFLHLGQIPGPDFDPFAAANLTGTDHRTAERLLEALLDHNLLVQQTPGRYRFHDLVGLYARTRCDRVGRTESEAALERLLDYYQHTARSADHHLARRTRPGPPALPAASVTAPRLADRDAALAWMRADRDNLTAAVTRATARAQHARAVALTASLATLLLLDGPWTQAARLHRSAAAAARTLGDRNGEAAALCDLGRTHHATGDYHASAELYERALAIYREIGDRRGEAAGLHELGRIRVLTGDYDAAAGLHELALAIFQDLGDRLAEARTLCDLGRARHSTGDSPAAIALMERVLALYRSFGDLRGEAGALHDLGYVLHETGDYTAAAKLHQRALTIYRDIGSRQGEAIILWNLGRARHATGDFPAAAELHRQALSIYRDIGSRQGEADALQGLGRVKHATGDLPAAVDFYQQALDIYRSIGSRPGQAELLTNQGALVADTTGPREALPLYQRATQLARQIHSPLDEARALEGTAHCSAHIGDRDTALADLRQAAAIYQRIGAPDAQAAADLLTAWETTGPAPRPAARPHGNPRPADHHAPAIEAARTQPPS